ncbi:ATP-binding protein [Stenotrophomonas sp.]|uniref:PAS domain-containing hybrid sensor histidine kinase/response regulator n=1 Tax=Stenotrophomonas sp. TaxID=69392 RepID=UPI0028A6A6B4|nr:ATP-binding protein [Stenotrophomonas sp.]
MDRAPADPMAMALCRGMEHASVAFALLIGQATRPHLQNAAFDALLVACHARTGDAAHLWDDPQVQAAVQACRRHGSERRLARDGLGYQLVFVPLPRADAPLLVQCFALATPGAAPPGLSPLLHDALQATDCQVCVFGQGGEIFWMNDAARRTLYGRTQVRQFHVDDWIQRVHPDDVMHLNAAVSRGMAAGRMPPVEYRMRAADGSYHGFVSAASPLPATDGIAGHWVSVSHDLHGLGQRGLDLRHGGQENSEQIEARMQRLLRMQSEVANTQKMELVGNLAGGVAHDLNNLLTVISLSISLLRKGSDEDAVLRHAAIIEKAVEKAGRMANQLMTFTGRKPRTATTIDPRQLLADIGDLLHKAVGEEGEFILRCAEDIHAVHVDRAYFENSLINLAVNARDATHGRGRIVMSLVNTVSSRSGTPGPYVQVTVSDNGMGMAEEVRAKVFEPFFTTKPTGKGSGLGLPMVASFVEQAGGFIDVESSPGAGTSVSFLLPVSGHAAEPVAAARAASPACGNGESVLLIEDDAQVRDALADMLRNLGYRVSTAYNPQAALHYLGTGLKVELIISDVRMPGPVTVLDMVHTLERAGTLPPLLFITGYAGEVLVQEGLIEGRYRTLFKPFSQDELCDAIRAVLPGGNG